MLLYTTVRWLSGLDPNKISEDRAYLLKANIEMKDEDFVRYDRIRFSEVGDRFDPFSIADNNHVKNSYIGSHSDVIMSSYGRRNTGW